MRKIVNAIFLLWIVVGAPCFATESSSAIRGMVKVAPRLEGKVVPSDVLYVFARPLGTQSGPPVAVVRIANPRFPQKFELGPQNSMMPGMPFQGPFQIQAKLSKTGTVTTSKGDLTGKYVSKNGVPVGASGIIVELSDEAH